MSFAALICGYLGGMLVRGFVGGRRFVAMRRQGS
jgi:hypothetical protein